MDYWWLVMFFGGAVAGLFVRRAATRKPELWNKAMMIESVFEVLDYYKLEMAKNNKMIDAEAEASLGAFGELMIETYLKRLAKSWRIQ